MLRSIRADDGGNDRSPWGSFWFSPISRMTASGARVSGESALRLSAVFACVRLLAETFSCLPFQLYRTDAKKSRTFVTDHWLRKLLARRPNQWHNPSVFRQLLMVHLCLRGNSWCEITTNGKGEITDLLPLHPDRVKPELVKGGDYRWRVLQADGSSKIVPREQLWHLKILSTDGILGMSPIEYARESLGMGLAAQDYGARFFANDATPGGWIEHKGTFKDEAAFTTFRDRWQQNQTGRNRSKTAILENGMSYHPVEITNVDSQFLESRKFSVTEIARIFRVPPHMIADLERSTNNNIEQQSLEFVTYSQLSWAELWEASIEFDLMLEQDVDSGLECEFDLNRFLRGSPTARANLYKSGIVSGWLTRNEARVDDGRNPIDGLDEPLKPLNMVDADEPPQPDGGDGAGDDAPTGNPKPAKDQPDRPNAKRLGAVVAAAAGRIARKEAKALERQKPEEFYGEAHAEYVADALAIPLTEALSYCREQLGVEHKAKQFEASTRLRLIQIGVQS